VPSGVVELLPQTNCIRTSYFCAEFVSQYDAEILAGLRQHVRLAVLATLLALAVAVPLALLARRSRVWRSAVLTTGGIVYTIPSLALFVLLTPLPGFGYLNDRSVLAALVLYNILVLVRNLLTGLDGVPPDVVDAARGMGYGARRLFTRVELPLAVPALIAGLRVATVSTVALVTVGGVLNQGGLGNLLNEGLQRDRKSEIMIPLLLIVGLALLADLLLLAVQRASTGWMRAGADK